MTVAAEPSRGRNVNDARADMRAVASMVGKSQFTKLGPAVERDVRKENVVKDAWMERLLNVWKTPLSRLESENIYLLVLEALGDFRCTKKETDAFVVLLKALEEDEEFSRKAGLFISALLNTSNEERYSIDTRVFGKRIDCLGWRNTKHLEIEGNVGDNVGRECIGGTIHVNGNAGSGAGSRMTDGCLTITGNVEYNVGYKCTGGKIVVEGDAGDKAGQDLNGGDLTIYGNARDWVGMGCQLGRITVRGNVENSAGIHMSGGLLVIKGNAGDGLGWNCGGGTILVSGNAGKHAGNESKRGMIFVCGNVREYAGTNMDGGSLIILGNAGGNVGWGCGGGTIHIDGEIESLAERLLSGRIYHKGVLIWSKERVKYE